MKKTIILTGTLASAIGFGALMGPGSSFADSGEVTSDSEQPAVQQTFEDHKKAHTKMKREQAQHDFITRALDMTSDELKEAKQNGKNLAEIVDEQGLSEEAFLDEVVKLAEEDLNAEAATKMKEHLQALLNGEQPDRKMMQNMARSHGAGIMHKHDELLDALDLTPDELRTALQEGETLSSLASEQGISEEDLLNKALNPIEDKLTTLVEEGKLTEDEKIEKFDQAKSHLQDVIAGEATPSQGKKMQRQHGKPLQ